MEACLITITVRNEKSYIPISGKTDSGIFVGIEPIYVCDLSVEEMAQNLQKVREAGHPPVRIETPEDRKKYSDMMLKATKIRSWKELARTGISYMIVWSDEIVRIQMSRLDKKGRWEFDPEKRRELPIETPSKEIVKIILEDVKSRQ